METLSKKQELTKTAITPIFSQRDPKVATVVMLYRDEFRRREERGQGAGSIFNGHRHETIQRAILTNPVIQRREHMEGRGPDRDFALPMIDLPIQRQAALSATISGYRSYLQSKAQGTQIAHTHPAIQPKLQVSQPNDPAEIEADSVSEQIMRMPDTSVYGNKSKNLVRRQSQAVGLKQNNPTLFRAESNTAQQSAGSSNLASRIQGLNGKGAPLPDKTRTDFEGKFGHSFENVRVHTGSESAQMAQSINAKAFTTGNNIVFGEGQYNTESSEGKKLLAHELTHTIQQGVSVKRDVIQRKDEDSGGKKNKLTAKINSFAEKTPGYNLLCTMLGKNPITGKRVPQHAKAYVRAFLTILPGGEAIYKKLDQSGAINRALNWLKAKIRTMNLSWTSIKKQLGTVWNRVSIWKVWKWKDYVRAFINVLANPSRRLLWFAKELLKKAAEFAFVGMMKMVGAPVGKIMSVLRKAGSAIGRIFADPKTFFKNLGKAVKSGFGKFKAGIWGFLKQGLFSWLFGAMAGAGLTFPKKFDLMGIFSLLTQIFGLTYQAIRARIVKRMGPMGETFVGFLEKSFDFVKALVAKGPMALWDKIQESMGNLKEMFFGAVIGWLRNTIIVKALSKIVLMLNPAGAIITVVKGIYDVVMFFMNNWQRIAAFVNSIFNSLNAITLSRIANASKFILGALKKSVPIMISFLARFLGLGGIAKKVTEVIGKIKKPVDKAVGKAVGWVVEKGKALWAKVKGVASKVADKLGIAKWWKKKKQFQIKTGEKHTIFFQGESKNARLMIASNPQPYTTYLQNLPTKNQTQQFKENKRNALNYARRVDAFTDKLSDVKFNKPKNDSIRKLKEQYLKQLNKAMDDLVNVTKNLGVDLAPKKTFVKHSGSHGDNMEVIADPLSRIEGNTKGSSRASVNIPGWDHAQDLNKVQLNWDKGHLLHFELHGPGNQSWNLVPVTKKTNSHMYSFENKAIADINAGKTIKYKTEVFFYKDQPPPIKHFPFEIRMYSANLIEGKEINIRQKDIIQAPPPATVEGIVYNLNDIGREYLSTKFGIKPWFAQEIIHVRDNVIKRKFKSSVDLESQMEKYYEKDLQAGHQKLKNLTNYIATIDKAIDNKKLLIK